MRILLFLTLMVPAISIAQISKPGSSNSGKPRKAGIKKFDGNSRLLVVADAEGALYVDYQKVALLNSEETWSSAIMAGSHHIELRNDDLSWSAEVELKSGNQKIVKTELQPKIAARKLNVQREEDSKKAEENDNDVLTIVEKMPEYPGGNAALGQFIGANMKYPAEAQANNIEGVVYVKFIVNTDGSVSGVKVARGVHPDLDAEAVRVVKLLSGYKPGTQRGKPVRVQYTIPLRFKLTN